MKIGVIGIGEMGGTLARGWRAAGHTVRVANSRGASAVQAFADEIGAEATDIYGAVDGAEVVLLVMAFLIAPTLPGDLFARAPDDLVIIDTANYYPDVRDARIAEIDEGMPESVWIARQIGRPDIQGVQQHHVLRACELRPAARRARPHCHTRFG